MAELRMPQQARSRERVDRILAAALELMADTGIEGVRMTEVAEHAGVPVGSIYQYFPDKAAIVRTLAERLTDTIADHVTETYAPVTSAAEFAACTDLLIQWFYESTLDDPASRDIQLALQSDVQLQELDLADTRRIAEVVEAAGRRFVTRRQRSRFAARCLLMVHTTAAVVRLAVVVPRAEGGVLVAEHRRLIRMMLSDVLGV